MRQLAGALAVIAATGLALVAVSTLSGCGKRSYILVSLQGTPSLRIDTLEVDVDNGGQTAHTRFARTEPFSPPQSFSLSFEQERSGDVAVTVVALLAGTEVARGRASTAFRLHETADLTITLGAPPMPMADMASPAPDLTTPSDLTTPPDLVPPSPWTRIDVGTKADLNGVWLSGQTILAVGDDPKAAMRGISVRSDDGGKTWSASTIATPPLLAAWGTAPNHVYAVGSDGAALEDAGVGWVRFFDLKGIELFAMSGPANDLRVAGNVRQPESCTVFSSIDNFKVNVAFYSPSKFLLAGFTSKKGLEYAVDDRSNVYKDGKLLVADLNITPRAVADRGAGPIVVGADGAILYIDSNTKFVTPMLSGVQQELDAVWCGSSDCFAVGKKGTVTHLGKNGWVPELTYSAADLRAVFGDENVVVAVGAGGEVLRRSSR